jgi:origin recognition complex subunit 2
LTGVKLEKRSRELHMCESEAESNKKLSCRRGHRINGRDGVGFVLKSLPENARSLYRILLIELLSAAGGLAGSDDEDAGENAVRREEGGARREAVI